MDTEESWKRISGETNCESPPGTPLLCENGCGFFGTAATMNLCSKCYKEFCAKEEQSVLAKAAMENLLNPITSTSNQQEQTVYSATADSPLILSSSSGNTGVFTTGSGVAGFVGQSDSNARNVCGSCKKRFRLMGFECKCRRVFCREHRFPEEHACSFDFKAAGRESLSKAHPVVKDDRFQRI